MKNFGSIEMKICENGLDHMIKMTAAPIYGKNLQKSSPLGLDARHLVCSIA